MLEDDTIVLRQHVYIVGAGVFVWWRLLMSVALATSMRFADDLLDIYLLTHQRFTALLHVMMAYRKSA